MKVSRNGNDSTLEAACVQYCITAQECSRWFVRDLNFPILLNRNQFGLVHIRISAARALYANVYS